MSVSASYYRVKDGVNHYDFEKLNSPKILDTVANECRSKAFYERMKATALLVATLATGYLAYLAVAAFATTLGLLATVLTGIGIGYIATQYKQTRVVLVPFIFAGWMCYKQWSDSNHYYEQAHLADLKKASLEKVL